MLIKIDNEAKVIFVSMKIDEFKVESYFLMLLNLKNTKLLEKRKALIIKTQKAIRFLGYLNGEIDHNSIQVEKKLGIMVAKIKLEKFKGSEKYGII